MRINRRILVSAAAGVVVVAVIVSAMRPDAIDVETALVSRGPLEATIDADGRTRVRQRYIVAAPVSGRVQRMTVREGTAVRAGTAVARIAPMPLDQQGLAQAQARVDAAVALASETAGQARLFRAALEQRQRELARARRLFEAGGVAQHVVEEANLAVKSAQEAVTGTDERRAAADAEVRHARAALVVLDPSSGTLVTVRSPAAGRVLRVAEASERIVAAGTLLLEIGDPESFEVVVDVLSSDAVTIRPGNIVRLGDWQAAGSEDAGLTGRVREVEPSAFTKVSALGVEEQRVNVIIDVDGSQAPLTLGDGFRVEASIVTWSQPDVLVVPASALVRNGSTDLSRPEWQVFVVRGGRVTMLPVRIGQASGTAAEVLAGLNAGDEVVLFPSDRVVDGVRVATQRR